MRAVSFSSEECPTEIGVFLEFGTDYRVEPNGVGQFSTAIIQRQDGTVLNLRVEKIKFVPIQGWILDGAK